MDWKKIGKSLLYPHFVIIIILIPISTVLLIGSMVFIGTESAIAYISCVISAYTLTVCCIRIPTLIKFFKTIKNENKYLKRWQDDTRLRINVSLYGSFAWNALYGIFQICLGFYHHTFWFHSLGAYYICLALMRIFLFKHTRKYAPGQRMHAELIKYRTCGWIFLVINIDIDSLFYGLLEQNL